MPWLPVVRGFLLRIARPAQLGVFALFGLAYANSFNGAFQFDDFNVIVDYAAVHSLNGWLSELGQGIRPLLKFTYLLNWISGAGVPGFHAVNLLIHGASVWLVYRLTQEFLKTKNRLQRVPLAPLLSAALFALHPVNTEAVTYISGRSSALMTLFYLFGLLVYVSGPARSGPWRAKILVPLSFLMALATKESAVTFPLALFLWDISSGENWKTSLRKGWTSWITLLIAAAFFLGNDAYRAAVERSTHFNSLTGNLATQTHALLYLFMQWTLPFWLNMDPDLQVQRDFSDSRLELGFVFVLAWVMVVTWRRRPWMGFALAWAFLHLSLLYVFVPRLDIANDRQWYLAAWPLGMALAVDLLLYRSQRMAAGVSILLLLGLATLTFLRNQDYQSEVSLWQQTVQLSPGKSRVHGNLGYAYQLAGQTVQARLEYLQALRLDPDNVKARLNLRRLNAERAKPNGETTPQLPSQ